MTEEFDPGLRRLPVYLVLDTSGSMHGDPIEAVRTGLQALVDDLKGNPQALETVWLSVITFDTKASQVIPLTEVGLFQPPSLSANGTTALGGGLKTLMECIDREVRKTTAEQKGDWKPLVFLMTDGSPTDTWEGAADELKKKRPGNVIACAAGSQATDAVLKRITETVLRLNDVSPGTLGAFMQWVTASITTTSASVSAQGDAPIRLPDIPKDKGIELIP